MYHGPVLHHPAAGPGTGEWKQHAESFMSLYDEKVFSHVIMTYMSPPATYEVSQREGDLCETQVVAK